MRDEDLTLLARRSADANAALVLVHRHADPLAGKLGLELVAALARGEAPA
jgi:hypothetical protein